MTLALYSVLLIALAAAMLLADFMAERRRNRHRRRRDAQHARDLAHWRKRTGGEA